jgi:hypothetical protein
LRELGKSRSDPTIFPPALFACVNYEFSFAASDHQTAYMAILARTESTHPGDMFDLFINHPNEVPLADMGLAPDLRGAYAD